MPTPIPVGPLIKFTRASHRDRYKVTVSLGELAAAGWYLPANLPVKSALLLTLDRPGERVSAQVVFRINRLNRTAATTAWPTGFNGTPSVGVAHYFTVRGVARVVEVNH